jgi:hypothetical protein
MCCFLPSNNSGCLSGQFVRSRTEYNSDGSFDDLNHLIIHFNISKMISVKQKPDR